MVSDGPAELLSQTVNTQPLMLTAAIATYRLWQEKGGRLPLVVAGHSLGEYSALVAAGVVGSRMRFHSFAIATAMQEAVPVGTGAMAAILNLDDDKIRGRYIEAAEKIGNGEVVEPVNFNGPGQTVIAGSKAAVEAACEGCKSRGAKHRTAARICSIPLVADSSGGRSLAARLTELDFLAPKFRWSITLTLL